MKSFKDYSEISEQICAPEELKRRVLKEARKTRAEHNKTQHTRGWSFARRAAVAAILALALPVTAFAAAKGWGLLDYLQERGMQNVEQMEELVNRGEEMSADVQPNSYLNKYAKYTVLEAACDARTMYLAAKVEPLDDETLLLPQYIMPEDKVVNLKIEGVTEGTVAEYAEALEKKIAYAGVGYFIGGNHLDSGEDFAYGEDGALYYYHSAQNISGEDSITLKCMGTGYDESMTMESIDRVEFVVQLKNKSSDSHAETFTVFDEKAYEDTGIQINTLTLEETEIGLYATVCFTAADAKFVDVDFKLVNGNGTELVRMPGVGGGTVENGDGSLSRTLYYQAPENTEGLQFVIRDFGSGQEYGPYTFGK